MTKKFLLIPLMLISSICFSQNFYEEYKILVEKGELLNTYDLLKKWQQKEPKNPEMYIAFFNYNLAKSNSMGLNNSFIGETIISTDSISFKEILRTKSKADSLFNIAQDYIVSGLKDNPKRLDMHFGRINTLSKQSVNDEFITAIIELLDKNEQYKNNWLWTGDSLIENPNEKVLNAIQFQIGTINNSRKLDKIKDILLISEKALNTYPDNHILLTNIGFCKLELTQYNEGITYFEKALNKKPKDEITLLNLADAYLQLEKPEKAKIYYEFIIENGKPEYVEYAKELLQKL